MSDFSYTKTHLQVTQMYRARRTVDERGAPGELIGVYTQKTAATNAATGQGAWGGDGYVDDVWVLQLPTGQGWLLQDKEPIVLNTDVLREKADARARALAKLDDADRKALNL